ncbi:FxsA family protein [Neobacillus sp. PS3-34]|uniref:FxsA family protein n=1 Tax=Neobacillus sp. PS3-34 TaxID=3070678 RepID=UPI0027DFDBB5|nr:FxsA family protein [Neobacillus sp. PS3-34]WML47313.1 FxsA family protein [Neobacillus sp. PS3-34]
MPYLILLIILVPAADIGILLFSGKTIGVLPTILFILLTGVVGAYLAKSQGLRTLRRAQEELRHGQIPGEAVLDGVCILIGGTLLITPGFITDILGFLMLLPPTRKIFKYLLRNSFKKWINRAE